MCTQRWRIKKGCQHSLIYSQLPLIQIKNRHTTNLSQSPTISPIPTLLQSNLSRPNRLLRTDRETLVLNTSSRIHLEIRKFCQSHQYLLKELLILLTRIQTSLRLSLTHLSLIGRDQLKYINHCLLNLSISLLKTLPLSITESRLKPSKFTSLSK